MVATEHLIGNATLYDRISHVLLGNTVEFYADSNRARFRVFSIDDPAKMDEVEFRQPNIVLAVHMIIAIYKEMAGVEGQALGETDWVVCYACGGQARNQDDDGNTVDCPACDGRGWIE